MEKTTKKNGKEILRRYLLFAVSLLIISFGIAVITRSDLGTSPISSVPYVASLNTDLTLGTYFFIFTVFLICIQLLLLGRKGIKERKIELLMQFPVAFFLSVFTDLSMWVLSGFMPELYIAKIVSLILGCVILAFGICLEVIADVTMISAEYTIQFATLRFKKEFGTIKICFDVSLVILAVLLSLLLSGRIDGIREGTIIAALITGPFVRLIMPRLKPVRAWLSAAGNVMPQHDYENNHPLVITVSREYGSGGHKVGEAIAKTLDIAFYDKELIAMAAKESGFSEKYISDNEQRLPGSILYQMILKDYEAPLYKSLSQDDALFVAESRVILDLARKQSCVIVGRCADFILKDRPNTVSLFIKADMQHKTARAISEYGIQESEAEKTVSETDRSRAGHYLHYTGRHWGDVRNYSATFDTGVFTEQEIASIVKELSIRRKN